MNRKKKLLVLLLLSLSVYFVYQFTGKKKLTYTVLGDSFSMGENSYGGYTYGYEDYLLDSFKEDINVEFIDFYTSKNENINTLYNKFLKDDIEVINKKSYNLKRVLTESDIITISIGLNDVFYECYVDKNVFNSQYKEDKLVKYIYKNFKNLMNELLKYGSNIYVIGYPERNEYKNIVEKLNNKYKVYCKNKKIVFIDTNTILDSDNYFDSKNAIFPNTLGYKKISEKIIKIYKNKEKS
jgi:lysophospholipase L1-like esterase